MSRKPATVEDRSVEIDGRRVKTAPLNVVTGTRDGQIHVHAAGCADLKRGEYRHAGVTGQSEDDALEALSLRDVVESVYGPGAGSFFEESGFAADDPEAWKSFSGEFRIFPCLSLQDETVFVDPVTDALPIWEVRYSLISEDGFPFGFADTIRAASIVRLPWALAEGHGVKVDRIDVTFAAKVVSV